MPIDVAVEEGRRRTFAIAIDWPGWARSGASRDAAIDALASYRERYAGVLASTALAAPRGTLRVTEVLVGDATTDFGAPGAIAEADDRALRSRDRERLATILRACWSSFDAVASRPLTLRTGPRGEDATSTRCAAT